MPYTLNTDVCKYMFGPCSGSSSVTGWTISFLYITRAISHTL